MRIFPRWRERLNLPHDVDILGVDLPIHAPRARYREVIERVKHDSDYLGGLVTTHKIDVYAAARDLFDQVDHFAALCGEVSCMAKRDGHLVGMAKDPINAGRLLIEMLGNGYFGRTGAGILCFGAGGAGMAITLATMTQPAAADRPRHIVVTDRDSHRLEGLRHLCRRLESDVAVDYVESLDPGVHDLLLSDMPPRSLIVNATGMGKDTPGSPVGAGSLFPTGSLAWDLNYRGDLQFLRTAGSQAASRGVRPHDGWRYFIYGWTSHIAEVFDRPISHQEIELLSADAAFARPPLSFDPDPDHAGAWSAPGGFSPSRSTGKRGSRL